MDNFCKKQIITYLGNKRSLIDFIENSIIEIKKKIGLNKVIFFDVFSGSGIISRIMKKHSSILHANDLELYSFITNKCYLSNRSCINMKELEENIKFLNENKLSSSFNIGFIEKLYAPKDDNNIKYGERVFFTNTNAKIIDNIRRMIDNLDINNNYLYIAPLIYKSSVHNNTSGVFKGFHKNPQTGIGQFGGGGKHALKRITQNISLPIPLFSDSECEIIIHNNDICNFNFLNNSHV